jgi:hypothetical protein
MDAAGEATYQFRPKGSVVLGGFGANARIGIRNATSSETMRSPRTDRAGRSDFACSSATNTEPASGVIAALGRTRRSSRGERTDEEPAD